MTEKKVPEDVTKYEKNYSESGFWKKVGSLGKKVLKPALTLYYVMKSPDVPFTIKTTIAGALGYLILPLDLIPDVVTVAGYTDDAAALLAVLKMCDSYVTPEIKAQTNAKLEELLG